MRVPRVSVIMNVHNGAAFLRETLNSVLAQSFTDWELIVWDDCSTDDSARIVAEYSDPRVRYFFSPEETPLGQARNLAMSRARGDWLAFLDQDDVWLSHKLQRQVALTENDPEGRLGLVYGRTVTFFPNGKERDFDHWHEFRPLPEGDIFVELFTDSGFIAFSSAMFRRSACREIGEIPDEVQLIPDYHLLLGVARLYRARAVQETVCRYRLHSTNMSHFNRRRIMEETLWLFDKWATCLDPRLVARRQRVYHTLLALAEMRHLDSAGRGVTRLLSRGSVGYVLSRPFVHAFRVIRRRIQQPYWRDRSMAACAAGERAS